jgi:NAD(P)-dependent dehydrogenase (short-subunit alcohol dehydrogenase family)
MDLRPVALVTGGARRLGREIALELAAQGWDVAVHYGRSQAEAHDTVQALRALGADAHALAADLADEAACRNLVPAVLGRFGRLRAVINNASLFEYDDVQTFGHALMDRHWRCNVAPAVLLAQALHAHLEAASASGCVVNLLDQKLWNPNPDYLSYTLSKAAMEAANTLLAQALHAHLDGGTVTGCVVNLLDQKLWNPNPDYLSYTLSKAALEAANTLLAQALAPRVRVCGVAPGVTLPSGPMDQAGFEAAHRLTPLQRSSTGTDIARAVRFLLESPAITGTTLLVDGGQHLSTQARDVMFLTKD